MQSDSAEDSCPERAEIRIWPVHSVTAGCWLLSEGSKVMEEQQEERTERKGYKARIEREEEGEKQTEVWGFAEGRWVILVSAGPDPSSTGVSGKILADFG